MYQLDTYIDDDTFFVFPVYTNPNRVTAIKETENGYGPYTENIDYIFSISPQGNNLLQEIKVGGSSYYNFTYNCELKPIS